MRFGASAAHPERTASSFKSRAPTASAPGPARMPPPGSVCDPLPVGCFRSSATRSGSTPWTASAGGRGRGIIVPTMIRFRAPRSWRRAGRLHESKRNGCRAARPALGRQPRSEAVLPPGLLQIPLDVTRELLEVVQPFGQHAMHDLRVDVQVAVHDHVSEPGDPTESLGERGRQDA